MDRFGGSVYVGGFLLPFLSLDSDIRSLRGAQLGRSLFMGQKIFLFNGAHPLAVVPANP